jgi:D-ribose pyranose/furanose isomerase RbsD
MKKMILVLSLMFFFGAQAPHAQTAAPNWHTKLNQELPLLGHRNWILIVDSAYPLQVSPGIETIETNADQLDVTREVVAALDRSIHVRPIVYLDAELPFILEQDFYGVNYYRDNLKKILANDEIKSLPHEQLLSKVDETAKTFKVLILKTNMAIPYTSVFLQLDCKYWSAESEQKLRQAMSAGTPPQ